MLRARRETLALDDVHEPSSDGLALADEVELGEELKDLLGDIARLPDDQRAALVLAELGDLSQQEIAATLDVRTDKVKALIFQAREALAGWRQARAVSCHEICEQLSTLKGSALRRAPIRRHLAVCPACTAFEAEVKHQRAALSLLLPVVPSVALKHSVLTAALSAGPGAGAGARAAAGAVRSRPGSPSRPWWSPRSRSARAAAAWSRCASSSSPSRSSAPRRRRARPWPLPWRRRRPARAVSGFRRRRPAPPRRSTPRAGRTRARPRARSKAQKAHGRGAAAVGGTLRPGPAARGGTRRPRPRSGRRQQTPAPAAKIRPAPATPQRPPAAKPPASKRKATPPAAARGKDGLTDQPSSRRRV